MTSAPAPEARLLVVDDEPNIVELLCASLRYAGFQVQGVTSGRDALDAALGATPPDLLVLDVMLPDLDGFAVTRRLRESGLQAPVLFLTARDGTDDKVTGLTVGGDDYVTKPFSLEEVIARIRAILRRSGAEHGRVSPTLAFADLELNEDSYEVRRGGVPVDLSPTEFKLLRYFLTNPNRVLSKSQILDHVWSYAFTGDASVVESYISYLRRKIDSGDGPRLLHTVRGVGYVLKLPPA